MSDWFFVPRSWEYGVPWVFGSVLAFVLGFFGLPTLHKFDAAMPRQSVAWLIAIAALLVWNGFVLWAHMRTQFLTFGTAWRRFTGTYGAMTGAFVVMFGIVSIAHGETRCTFRDATLHDTTHAAVLALSAISVSWGLSAAQFLKIEEPGIGGVRLKRRNALQSLSTLIGGRLTIAAMDALIDTINDLSSDAQAAITSLPEEADRQLARTWAQAAASLHELLEGLSPNDFRDIRAKLVSDVRDNMRELARTC